MSNWHCSKHRWYSKIHEHGSWWRHQMELSSALLALCAGNSPATGEFPAQRPVTRGFDVFFDLRPNKRLSKQAWGWWFEAPSHSLWRHCNGYIHKCGVHLSTSPEWREARWRYNAINFPKNTHSSHRIALMAIYGMTFVQSPINFLLMSLLCWM